MECKYSCVKYIPKPQVTVSKFVVNRLKEWTNEAHQATLSHLLRLLNSLQEHIPTNIKTPSHLNVIFKWFDYFLQPQIPLGVKNEALPSLSFFLSIESFSAQVCEILRLFADQ
jgi:hypothetical protein